MNNYETILSLASQADAPLEDIFKKQSEFGEEAQNLAQTVGGAMIHGSTKNIIEHLTDRVGKARDDIIEGLKQKLAEAKEKIMDKITEAKDEGQAKFNEVVNNLKPEGAEDELNPVLSYLRNLQVPHNFDETDEGNIILRPYTDEEVERGIREVSPELSDDEVNTGVRVLNDNQAYTEQFPSSVDDPLTLETQRLLQRQKLGKVGSEAMDNDTVELGIDANPALRANKDVIMNGLKDDDSFNELYKLRFPNRPPLTAEQTAELRKETFQRFKAQGEKVKAEPTSQIEEVETPLQFQDTPEAPLQFQDTPEPPTQFQEPDEPALSAEDLLPEGSGRVMSGDVDLRQLTGQRRAVSSELNEPVQQNTTNALSATDELQGGQLARSRQFIQNQRQIQQQINDLREVPEGERPADLPFLQRQTLADLPADTPPVVPTPSQPVVPTPSQPDVPTSTALKPIDAPVDDEVSQATSSAIQKVAGETEQVSKSVISKLTEDKLGSIGSKLAEATEESAVGDETGVGDILTLGLGLATLFTGGLFHHAPKIAQPVVSQLLNPTYQMGINE